MPQVREVGKIDPQRWGKRIASEDWVPGYYSSDFELLGTRKNTRYFNEYQLMFHDFPSVVDEIGGEVTCVQVVWWCGVACCVIGGV